jgi:hypothetical protein
VPPDDDGGGRGYTPNEAILLQAAADEPSWRQALNELNLAHAFPVSPITPDIRVRVQMATKDLVMNGEPVRATPTRARKEMEYRWQTDVLPKPK